MKTNEAKNKKYTMYYNPRCNTSRAALDRLKAKGIQPKLVEFLKFPIHPNILEVLLKQLKMKPEELVRKSEERYYDLELDRDPPKRRGDWIQLLANNPVLIERPIISDGFNAVIALKTEKLDELVAS